MLDLQKSGISPMARGLYYTTSFFNHCCLPNASYQHIGDLMVVTASRPIHSGEELFVTYVGLGLPLQDRQEQLQKFNFECTCPLCEIETALNDDDRAQRQYLHLMKDEMFVREFLESGNMSRDTALGSPTHALTKTLATYGQEYENGMPYLRMLEPMFRTAHLRMGPVSHWVDAQLETQRIAYSHFMMVLYNGLRIDLIEDPTSDYCELSFSRHSQNHPIGILSLVALAELAYLSTDEAQRRRALPLLRGAKEMYKLYYIEDATFEDRHGNYKCMELTNRISEVKPPENWEEMIACGTATIVPLVLASR